MRKKISHFFNKFGFFIVKKKQTKKETHKKYLANRDQARIYITNKVRYFNEIYKFSYNRISIKNQKTCWGSCSKKGNLNFNYKIIYLPEIMADYIIVHEICHLKELNHSRRFWNLVFMVIPEYAKIRKELRRIRTN